MPGGARGRQGAPPKAYQQLKDGKLPIRKLSFVLVNHIEVDIFLASRTKMLHSELVTNKEAMKCEGFSKKGAWPMEDGKYLLRPRTSLLISDMSSFTLILYYRVILVRFMCVHVAHLLTKGKQAT